MSKNYLNVVIDISHHQSNVDFAKVAGGGIRGVIHKSTNASAGRDAKHDSRRPLAHAEQLLWGSYHFGTGDTDGVSQAKFFLDATQPQTGDLLALDYEPNKSGNKQIGPDMTIKQAREFVQHVADETGNYPMLYSSSFLKDKLNGKIDPVLVQCPLWLARYNKNGTEPVIPNGWTHWTLWQYTGDGIGHDPMTVPGIKGEIERDYFIGKLTQLEQYWGQNLNAAEILPIPGGLPAGNAGVTAAKKAVAKKAAPLPAPPPAPGTWSGVFRMDLGDSQELLRGTLTLHAPDGKEHAYTAACGAKTHQDFSDLWVAFSGPVPPNPDTKVGNGFETAKHVGPVVKHGYKITPEVVKEPKHPFRKRDHFRVHFDGGDDGSAGCIALTHKHEWDEFVKLMAQLQKAKVDWMSLELDYV
jgi:lysozyme